MNKEKLKTFKEYVESKRLDEKTNSKLDPFLIEAMKQIVLHKPLLDKLKDA